MSQHPRAVLTVDGDEYTLQFTRDAIRMLEGMNAAPTNDGRDGMPMQLATTMFYAALRLHHKNVNQTQATAIFDNALESGIDFQDLITLLMELYNSVFVPPVAKDGNPKASIQRIGMSAEEATAPKLVPKTPEKI